MAEIKNAYLMWVGSEHYKSIDEWIKEAELQGISKRLPNAHVAKAMMEPGTVVFVAHDEGEYRECPKCFGTIENPERRKMEGELGRVQAELDEISIRLDDGHPGSIESRYANGIITSDERDAEKASCEKLAANREEKVSKLNYAINEMDPYIEAGTGGKVVLLKDDMSKESWDYRRYNYWLHQPGKFDASDVIDKEMCECCGGTGRLPEGKVFGMFIPGDFEYIVPEETKPEVMDKIRKMGLTEVEYTTVKAEPKRKCGHRKPGGVYAVAKTSAFTKSEAMAEAVAALVAEGKLGGEVQVKGQFAHFLCPVPIDVKRFRGVKRWSLDPAVEDEAEMIAEAM